MSSRFINAYMDWFAESTDAPFAFGEASALMCLSTIALGRRWIAGADKVNANLYLMLVGPSSRARKSTTIKRAREIIEIVNPGRVGPTDYTAEGLFKWMSEKDDQTGKSRTRLTLFASEFAADLARSAGYKNSFRDDLTNLYDGFDIEKVRAGFGKNMAVHAPRVSVFAAVTYEGLRANTTGTDWHTGFLMRFLYVTPIEWRELRVIPADANNTQRDFVAWQLTQLKETLMQNPQGLTMTPDATQLYAQSYLQHMRVVAAEKRTQRELPSEVYMQRFWPNVRKLALLYQLDTDPNVPISYMAMQRALAFAANCWNGYVHAQRETTIGDFSTLAHAVVDEIKKSPTGLPMAQLTDIFGPSMVMGAVLKFVEAANLVRRQQLPDGSVLLFVRKPN